ncbi:SDR family NAD(P)-dependent oxidoreductase [Plantibacter sp. Mn2098]|uniref:SDR family NAD(P)-dependent oxidoreductase n=1 Tax=Plantibacter sp. Mn2098 TaxID=3395266 RepID=UPI003BCB7DC3
MATALVTGGTSGIGAAFARALARRGFDLVLVARDEDRLEQVAAELRRTGRSVETLSADLADRAQVQLVAERLSDPERPIRVLVNNAGFGLHALLTGPDQDEFDRAFEVMGRSVYILSAAAARSMRERGRGTIINVSSTAGFITMGMYSALKAFVTTYSEALSVELADTGVTVTAVCPGWVHTEFHERAGINTSSIPAALWIDADRLADDGLRDAGRGIVVSIPSRRFQTLIWFARHAPRSLVRGVSGRLSSSRRKSIG